ncbi:MAG: CBS domain-containing protein, partial [Gammaproteobacteria bacterium]
MEAKVHANTQQHSWLSRIKQAFSPPPKNKKQLSKILVQAEQDNLLTVDTLGMVESVLQFAEMQVRDIMVPRNQMVKVEEDQPLQELLKIAIDSGHSRFPAIDESGNEVIGILHAKDLLQYKIDKQGKFDLTNILRPAVVVPESKHLDVLLKEFRTNRNHMAIVIDEYGSIAGFVTIEDILEQIVGDIEDEFDIDEDAFIKKHSEKRYIIKAHMPLEDFNEYFNEMFDL